MTSTAVQQISTEDVKQAIIALVKENNAEFKQLLVDLLPNLTSSTPKRAKNKQAPQKGLLVKKERIPYSEMPFWKANPHLKPRVHEGTGITMEAIKELQSFFQEPGNEITDEWFEMLD